MPSDLQVSNIKDLTGSNTGLSIASDGQVTISQNNPTLTLGSNATFTGEHYHYTSGYSNSWETYDWTNATSNEDGIRVYRMGVIYMVHFSIQKNTNTGLHSQTVLNLGSHITHPTNTVYLGNQIYANASGSQHEYFIASTIESNGDINVRVYNDAGAYSIVFASMMGMDIA